MKLKKLNEQVIVLTGASSGIGLVTARMAAKQGAKLVVAARSEEALRQLVAEITAAGGEAIHVMADVAEEDDVQRIADEAVKRFGGFDTWVNNAGVSVYGTLLEVPREDMRQVFETNFWGLVNGSLVAARHLRSRGGAIVNVGSTLSDRAIPLQGMYSASKHAVKGFTDALRMELEAMDAPVSVSLVKPAAIDTPYTKHARNYLDVEPKNPPPVYAPEVVAEVILHCATHPLRDVFAGAGGKLMSAQGYYAPRLTDIYMEGTTIRQQRSDEPARGGPDGLFDPAGQLEERGGYPGRVFERSAYSQITMRPWLTTALLLGAGLGAAVFLRAGEKTAARAKVRRASQPGSSGPPQKPELD
jgi:short-subunit dehydrogenase